MPNPARILRRGGYLHVLADDAVSQMAALADAYPVAQYRMVNAAIHDLGAGGEHRVDEDAFGFSGTTNVARTNLVRTETVRTLGWHLYASAGAIAAVE